MLSTYSDFIQVKLWVFMGTETNIGEGIFTQTYEVINANKGGFAIVKVLGMEQVAIKLATDDGGQAEAFYNRANEISCDFILRTIQKIKVGENIFLVYEAFDMTLEEWVLSNFEEIDNTFLQILRDVLRGLSVLYFKAKSFHGNLGINDIVLKGKRAKIINMRVDRGALDDCKAFAELVKGMFSSKGRTIPKNFLVFLEFLAGDYCTLGSKLENISNHPIFFGPTGRLMYRVIGSDILQYESPKKGLKFYSDLQKKFPYPFDWASRAPEKENFKESIKMSSDKPLALHFLRGGRNIAVHGNEKNVTRSGPNSSEDIEADLDHMWPEFLFGLHEVFAKNEIKFPVYDTMLK